ncbi:MAG: transketolase family protein [Methanomassiliicoccales archaeon]|nr:transketolase family protein [Methanomassiliicoccales archaeon]
MRKAFVSALTERAATDEKVFVITPDMGYSVLDDFAQRYPRRYLNCGVAEQNSIGVAGGLALTGMVPYVYSIIPFVTMRCFEQVRVHAAWMNLPIRIVGIGAGFTYGTQGASHFALEDMAIMRALPNMTVCAPGDPIEARGIIEESFERPGPMYIRLGKSGEPNVHAPGTEVRIGKAITVIDGKDMVLITTSNTLMLGFEMVTALRGKGVDAGLVSMHTIKPLDVEKVLSIARKGIPIVTLEEHSIIGGLGSAVAEVLAESGSSIRFKRLGVPDEYPSIVGDQRFLRSKLGMDTIDDATLRWLMNNGQK